MLPKKERLTREREINEILRSKELVGGYPLLFYYVGRENQLPYSRMVIITPRRLGKATARSRLKRVFAAAFSKIRINLSNKIDLVLFPKAAALRFNSVDVVRMLKDALSMKKMANNDMLD